MNDRDALQQKVVELRAELGREKEASSAMFVDAAQKIAAIRADLDRAVEAHRADLEEIVRVGELRWEDNPGDEYKKPSQTEIARRALAALPDPERER